MRPRHEDDTHVFDVLQGVKTLGSLSAPFVLIPPNVLPEFHTLRVLNLHRQYLDKFGQVFMSLFFIEQLQLDDSRMSSRLAVPLWYIVHNTCRTSVFLLLFLNLVNNCHNCYPFFGLFVNNFTIVFHRILAKRLLSKWIVPSPCVGCGCHSAITHMKPHATIMTCSRAADRSPTHAWYNEIAPSHLLIETWIIGGFAFEMLRVRPPKSASLTASLSDKHSSAMMRPKRSRKGSSTWVQSAWRFASASSAYCLNRALSPWPIVASSVLRNEANTFLWVHFSSFSVLS